MTKPHILEAIDALKGRNRQKAVELIKLHMAELGPAGEQYRSIHQLALRIGEIDLALEAARRFAETEPKTLERRLFLWGQLASLGRIQEARRDVMTQSPQIVTHPAVQHFLGTIANQEGDFEQAERHLRIAINAGQSPQSWFALAMLKTFKAGDEDLAEMERLVPELGRFPDRTRAAFFYGLAKAHDDIGDIDTAMGWYDRGAQLRSAAEPYDRQAAEAQTEAIMRDAKRIDLLLPSAHAGSRAVFVNGLPRSGTTLVEQILTASSTIIDGGEINLFRAALSSSAGGVTLTEGLNYQRARTDLDDPWGEVARCYEDLLRQRFGGEGRVVDKTLLQSRFTGLLMHAMPDARIIWMRRKPEDVALSCYRTCFNEEMRWSWSFEDIAHFFEQEDRLYRFWQDRFPGSILTVPYEELVTEPDSWIGRIAEHVGIADEPEMHQSHLAKRAVRTASVRQVREPISADAVGKSARYGAYVERFRAAYDAGAQ